MNEILDKILPYEARAELCNLMDNGYGVQKHNFDLDIFQFDENIKYQYFFCSLSKIWKVWKSYLHFPPFWHGFFSLVHSSLSAWYSHRSPANSRFRDGAYFGKAHWQKKSLKKERKIICQKTQTLDYVIIWLICM